MATVEELRARREALERNLNSGAARIEHGDKKVTNRTAAEIERQIARLDEQIAAVENGGRRRRVFYIQNDRGF